MQTTNYFYLRTKMEETTDGELAEYGFRISDSLNKALDDTPSDQHTKLRRMEFEPLPDEERFQLAPTFFAPRMDMANYLGYRAIFRKKGRFATAYDAEEFARLELEYTQALEAMSLPASYVELPPQYFVDAFGSMERRYTRAGVLAVAAAVNQKTIRKRREHSKGVDAEWAIAVEIGRPVPCRGEQMITIGQVGIMHIGTMLNTTMSPIRIVVPTPEELDRHRINWAEYLPTANA